VAVEAILGRLFRAGCSSCTAPRRRRCCLRGWRRCGHCRTACGPLKLNAPNDVVVAADGAIWFTDPGYGIFGNYEGHLAEPELPPRVYRLDAKTGQATAVADDFDKPNGLAFSLDEKKLYIIDSGLTHGGRSNMRVFDVNGDKLANGKVFAENFAPGFTDGVRTDIDGNVWCSMGWADPKEDGVRC
jgi:gluconolactonase